MNFEIKEGKRILEVCFQKHYTEGKGFDSYNKYYYVTTNPDIKIGDVVMIESNYKRKSDDDDEFGLQFCKVTDIMDPYTNIADRVEQRLNKANKAVYPYALLTIDLSEYFKQKEEERRIKDIKREMNEAVKELDEMYKYKQLAELNPRFKGLYEELISLTNKNLLVPGDTKSDK